MVVEDDSDSRELLTELLGVMGYHSSGYSGGDSALAAVARGYSPHIAVVDVMMPGTDGLEVLQRLRGMCPATSVLMLSAASQPDTVLRAARLGAVRYLSKPIVPEVLEVALGEARDAYRLACHVQKIDETMGAMQGAGEIVTADPAMLRLQEVARRVADTDVPVLITGESGVGKEVLARFVHAQSQRRGRAFVKVNCAALPHDLLESELFGHQKGAFTGAVVDRPGKFEQADRGTIFLDEIGEMSPALQAKMLHVLQDGEFCRVGGRSMKVDARAVVATNRRLEEMVARGQFREDLYYRLNVVRLEVPPLRRRPGDVPLLLRFFLKKYASKYHRTSLALPDELTEAFLGYAWPGNVRELENAVKRYVVLQDLETSLEEMGRIAPAEWVAEPCAAAAAPPALGAAVSVPVASASAPGSLKKVASLAAEAAERELILRTLDGCAWNRKQAAREMNICYKALLNKLKRWNLGRNVRPRATPS
jgi:two-component system response regulator AtoC